MLSFVALLPFVAHLIVGGVSAAPVDSTLESRDIRYIPDNECLALKKFNVDKILRTVVKVSSSSF